jgi:hypothetical protein
MKKLLLSSLFLSLSFYSCRSLSSVTSIKANDAFILGNNKHGDFEVKLKNISNQDLELWETPIDGGRHSALIVKPKQTVKVKVDKNTALRVNNNSGEEASVELLVKGDLGLSMGYQN